MKPQIAIIMGSDSDLEVMSAAAKILDGLHIGYILTIVSAHRTPERMAEFAENADKDGIKVIIAAAGGAAHLPGMTASYTNIPVIGVPIKTKTMDGIDSILSITQMPPGVPVATVAINGAQNAALLAAQILAISDPQVKSKIKAYRQNMKSDVLEKARKIEEVGFNKFLSAQRKAK